MVQRACRLPLSLLLSVLCACSEPAVEAPIEPARVPVVETVVLARQSWVQRIHGFGVVEPAEQVVIAPDFLGTVVEVAFEAGDPVAAGQVLIRFDPAKRTLRLDEAEAALTVTRADLEEAEETLARRRVLLERGTVSVETFRAHETTVRGARARVAQAVAARDLARRNLEDTTLVSPAAGTVMRRTVDPGQTVLAGTQLAVIDATRTMRVLTYVTEKDVNALAIGSHAEVTSPGVPGRVYPGRVEVVGFMADPRTGNFQIKVAVPNDDGLLRPGMTARVTLTGLVDQTALLVPRTAIADRDRRRRVFTVIDGYARAVEPLFAAVLGDALPVLEGLAAGDEIIVGGVDRVVDGSPVRAARLADHPENPADAGGIASPTSPDDGS